VSQAVRTLRPWNAQILSTQDLTDITTFAFTLPGKWRFEPDVAIRPSGKACVWIYPSNDSFPLSLGFAKEAGLFYVTVRHDHEDSQATQTPIQFPTLSAAFTSLWESLVRLDARREGCKRRWRMIWVSCGCVLFMIALLIAIYVSIGVENWPPIGVQN
jgi:hypothetical protein